MPRTKKTWVDPIPCSITACDEPAENSIFQTPAARPDSVATVPAALVPRCRAHTCRFDRLALGPGPL